MLLILGIKAEIPESGKRSIRELIITRGTHFFHKTRLLIRKVVIGILQ